MGARFLIWFNCGFALLLVHLYHTVDARWTLTFIDDVTLFDFIHLSWWNLPILFWLAGGVTATGQKPWTQVFGVVPIIAYNFTLMYAIASSGVSPLALTNVSTGFATVAFVLIMLKSKFENVNLNGLTMIATEELNHANATIDKLKAKIDQLEAKLRGQTH